MEKCRLPLLFLALLLQAASTAAACHPDDLHALQGFAGNLSGGGIILLRATWSGASCCGWVGVGCDGATGRVTMLWLPGRGLAGPIPGRASLAGLARLESLNLANNKLVGTIPSWIGELDHLRYLDLSNNSLVEEVPRNLQIRLKGLTIAGGVRRNRITLGGQPNTITGSNNSVRSGRNNVVSGNDNTVISGNKNVVSGNHNTVVSGSENVVSGSHHGVSGTNHVVTGNNNAITRSHNTVSGSHNTVSGSHNTVSGSHNTVTGSHNTVSGSNHIVSGSNKVVTGA